MKNQSKKTEPHMYMTLGMSLGMCFGVAFGAVFDSIGVGISIGMSLGVGVGAMIDYKKNRQNKTSVIHHYDSLVDENNDPVHDPEPLRMYMDKWDGQLFFLLIPLSPRR